MRMRIFLMLFFALTLVPLGLGQQKARISCINAKAAPLFASLSTETKVVAWIKCESEVQIISVSDPFYFVEAEVTSGQTVRGYLDKFWLTIPFLPSATLPVANQSSNPAASISPPSNSEPPPPVLEKIQPPSVVGSTYPISYPVASGAMRARGVRSIHKTIHLYEDEDKLTMDVTWPDGGHTSQSIGYGKVNFVTQSETEDIEGDVVDIEDDGNSLSVPVRSLREANQLAEYVARKSPQHLELIGDAWRVRKPFDCPEANQIGCRDFKELLDHDDADIVSAFYSRDGKNIPNYACFSDSNRRFFTMFYSTPRHYRKTGFFFQHIFIEGQSSGTNFHDVEWSRMHDDYGTIFTSSATPGAKQSVRSPVGHITQADLEYQTKYTDKSGTETRYSLSVRWSTGRYAESVSSKDEKGRPLNDDETGICVKLN